MKRLTHLALSIAILIAVSATFTSCKKENNTNDGGASTGSGEIEYLGKKYAVNYGYYELYGQFEGIYNYQLYLFSDGVDIEKESGFGNVIAIYFSTYLPPLSEGTIPYYSDNVDPCPTFEAEVVLEYNLDTDSGIRLSYFADGELTISKSSDNNTYTIQFNCVVDDEESLSGNYTGKITEF